VQTLTDPRDLSPTGCLRRPAHPCERAVVEPRATTVQASFRTGLTVHVGSLRGGRTE